MMMRPSPLRGAAGLALALLLTPAAAPAQEALSTQRIWGTGDFSGELESVRWSADPAHYLTLDRSGNGSTDLVRVHARTGRREVVVAGDQLVPPGSSAPVRIEEYAFSPDGRRLLLFTNSVRVWRSNTKGTYYVWDLDGRRLLPVSRAPGHQMFAKFAADGRRVAFVRDHNLFLADPDAGTEVPLTRDGNEDVINGTTDWVYEEELGLRDAFRMAPAGDRIAFWRLDQSAIPPFYLLDETQLYPELLSVRYPKAGTANSTVRLGVTAPGAPATWIDIGGERDHYIAAMDFAGSADVVWFTRLNRHQNRLELLLADLARGTTRVLLADSDAAWVDAVEPHWIRGGREFLWTSERDGHNQLYLYRRDGTLIRKLTPGAWDVTSVHGVDERRGIVYFSGAGEGPLERHLYRVGLDGRGLTRLTDRPGTHGISFNADFSLFVDTYSTAAAPPVQGLHDAQGRLVRMLAPNRALHDVVAGLGLTPPEFLQLPAADGTPLHAWLIRPPDFDPARQYPLLLYVYGGPGSQTVRDVWGGQRYLWHQFLARQGYLVASVDNRGTGARGRAFKKQTYLRLGQLEAADQIAAARYFGALPYVDAGRIGIWGWSYGGYMSSLSVFLGHDVFRAAIAVAPVTDWRLYDTIYTERFMRTPEENPDGYREGAPLTHVERFRGHLLLVHGTGDDNVHAQNSIQLVEALENANRQFDFRLYPNKTHSIAGRVTRVNLYELFTEWTLRNL